MKLFILVMIAVSLTVPARAYELSMTQGKDSYIFDLPAPGKTIKVYQIDADEPPSDAMEGLMHDRFIMEDILNAVPQLHEHPLNFWNARTLDPSVNAFAAIRYDRRYIVLNPSWLQDHWARIFVLGHELGHHVCGHTAGIMADKPWDRELEADRFSGMLIRAMEQAGNTTLQIALQNGLSVLSEQGSTSHPPRSMRIASAIEGYNNGSSCVGRVVASNKSSEGGTYTDAQSNPLWSHNGSTMRLIASGSSRQFVYEDPRAGLGAEGVQKGSVLFEGVRRGANYLGTAYVYSRDCGKLGFPVSGRVSADDRSVSVSGKAPARLIGCRPAGYRDESLLFTYLGK